MRKLLLIITMLLATMGIKAQENYINYNMFEHSRK